MLKIYHVLVAGDECSGKSRLISNLLDIPYKEHQHKGFGLDIYQKRVAALLPTNEEKLFIFHDCSGNIDEETFSNRFDSYNLCLYCIDQSKDINYEEIEKNIANFKKQHPQAEIYLIATKIDLNPDKKIDQRLWTVEELKTVVLGQQADQVENEIKRNKENQLNNTQIENSLNALKIHLDNLILRNTKLIPIKTALNQLELEDVFSLSANNLDNYIKINTFIVNSILLLDGKFQSLKAHLYNFLGVFVAAMRDENKTYKLSMEMLYLEILNDLEIKLKRVKKPFSETLENKLINLKLKLCQTLPLGDQKAAIENFVVHALDLISKNNVPDLKESIIRLAILASVTILSYGILLGASVVLTGGFATPLLANPWVISGTVGVGLITLFGLFRDPKVDAITQKLQQLKRPGICD